MNTPKMRARWARGALVGASSAAMTLGAHAAAGGGALPVGSSLVLALLVCATVGALAGAVRSDDRRVRWLATTSALGGAQFLGHIALALTGQHHDALVPTPGPSMIAAHIAAAVLLGGAISAAEYLYAVCASVLHWLRLFILQSPRPMPRARRRATRIVVPRPVLATGLGMRAPPHATVTA
ncbi:hypothetical protein [Mycolicibacterium gilvum]|uniref:hypothetical protein n=1 Tax=Mycolicibacterium gilvum TaxID=1804 RepID=UPI0040465C07